MAFPTAPPFKKTRGLRSVQLPLIPQSSHLWPKQHIGGEGKIFVLINPSGYRRLTVCPWR
ncbi:hypothetical protein T09_14108 [Trichinella sp. T9]|nr:hypothetical protein T09_14108 [Trichinella sp. T9]